ncbi:MAG: endonuclease MutS2 [Alicyclobacillaceae bacterium]|nr:endonuclease MutS2 [Alicyclobacillaceae bacterium]
MDERSLHTLELDKLKQQMQAYAACALGRDALEQLAPLPSPEAAEAELQAVDECVRLLVRVGPPPFGGVTDVRADVRRAAIGGVLDGVRLAGVARFIAGGRRVRGWLEGAEGVPLQRVAETASRIFDARQTELEIRRVVDDDGHVLDNASDLLRRLRAERRAVEGEARQILERMIRTHARYLQDPVVVLRGDSLCLPVKVEYRHVIRGVVHDVSSSGATVFIEPEEVVRLGRRAQELKVQEEREIERILTEVSAVVGGVAEQLLENARALADLDRWFAKAGWAKAQGCERPELRRDGVWRLVRARHPLLARETAVPMDVTLGETYRMIIITGPNTGGKTVALKTIGLLTVLAMCGCFIPARAGSAVAWCDDVFVDIGDEQSIEQSLSTFSSHMRNIVRMLHRVTPDSLVLLDELGAGTDPTEGAALAVAILDYLKERGCRVVATTHYAELKAYAFREPLAINASVEFDVETLRPTYRLQVGIPGRSNALAIAERLGVPASVVERARSALHTNEVRVEDILTELEKVRREAEQARAAATAEREHAEVVRRHWEAERERLEAEAGRIREQAERQARELVERVCQEADRIIRELRAKRREGSAKDHELVALRQSLEALAPEQRLAARAAAAGVRRRTPDPAQVEKGALVRVLSLGQKGEVIERTADGELTVQFGSLRMKVGLADVEVLQPAPSASAPATAAGRGVSAAKDVRLEFDVRGETVDEAIARIDKYLDDAVVAGLRRVVIIHGKGTGALRDGVRRYLSGHPQVKSYAPAGPGEGGDGATVVTLNA